jgi:hypothetical protein
MSTTIRTVGATARDHATWALWEAATDNDLVTGTVIEEGHGYDDADFTAGVLIAGATTSALYYRHMMAAEGEEFNVVDNTGVWVEAATADLIKVLTEQYVRISNIGAQADPGSAESVFRLEGHNFVVDGCYATTVTDLTICFRADNGSSGFIGIFQNCIAAPDAMDCAGCQRNFAGSATSYYNCVAYFPQSGGVGFFLRGSGNIQNCIAASAGDDLTAGFNVTISGTESNNASDDATAGGDDSLIEQDPVDLFIDAGSNNFILKSGSNAIGAGIDKSGVFTLDIRGNPHGAAVGGWDMGAYAELAVAAGGAGNISTLYHYYLEPRC